MLDSFFDIFFLRRKNIIWMNSRNFRNGASSFVWFIYLGWEFVRLVRFRAMECFHFLDVDTGRPDLSFTSFSPVIAESFDKFLFDQHTKLLSSKFIENNFKNSPLLRIAVWIGFPCLFSMNTVKKKETAVNKCWFVFRAWVERLIKASLKFHSKRKPIEIWQVFNA